MITVVGVSHKTAPIELREQLALSKEAAAELCVRLVGQEAVAEAFVVSTCNRVEIVAAPRDPGALGACAGACLSLLCEFHPELRSHAYSHLGPEGMRHLVRVASSLDSLVVGEPQILGQIKQGFELAREQGTVGGRLHRAFSSAVRGAKQVRSETSIGSGQVSVPSIAVQLAAQIFGDLQGHKVVLVGSGEMGQAVARLLADQGAQLSVVGRSLERVRQVTDVLGGEAKLMEQLPEVLGTADVVVSSTSAPSAVITKEDLLKLKKVRRGRNLFLIDLAVPRDIDPRVNELDSVFLYNIDDLSHVALESAESRKREADRALVLVDEVVRKWQQKTNAEGATPTIKALRGKMQEALLVEMQRSLKGRLRDLNEDQRQALSKMIDAGVNRILHGASVRLRQAAEGGEGDSLDDVATLLAELFELGQPAFDSLAPAEASSQQPQTRSSPSLVPRPAEERTTELTKVDAACVGSEF